MTILILSKICMMPVRKQERQVSTCRKSIRKKGRKWIKLFVLPPFLFVGATIERFCDITSNDLHAFPTRNDPHDDRIMMVRAARTLLSAVTRVLLLADIVVVKQLLLSKERVGISFT